MTSEHNGRWKGSVNRSSGFGTHATILYSLPWAGKMTGRAPQMHWHCICVGKNLDSRPSYSGQSQFVCSCKWDIFLAYILHRFGCHQGGGYHLYYNVHIHRYVFPLRYGWHVLRLDLEGRLSPKMCWKIMVLLYLLIHIGIFERHRLCVTVKSWVVSLIWHRKRERKCHLATIKVCPRS